ncbi:hypothetical protein BVC71_13310 [Marivivens niveibacter]|uniref:Uncharacterized protein n=1 Tax=Marivivens niveibacter TaxID=1930667 RepID=A0A251WWY2_9RHOB|nr:hypothetical protein [Marivivens niveibacter]OUD08473.1 hypothetical protein BVC71_13310 [Marivivens niveibacter]
MTKKLGRLVIADYSLHLLEQALIRSFEARRGRLFDTLLALNALAVRDLGISGLGMSSHGAIFGASRKHKYTLADAEQLVFEAVQRQLEPELVHAFRYPQSLQRAKRLGGAPGITKRLEKLVPHMLAEFTAREANGDLAPKTGLLRWLVGKNEFGGIEPLLEFTHQSLFWTSDHLNAGRHEAVAKRLEDLCHLLPI